MLKFKPLMLAAVPVIGAAGFLATHLLFDALGFNLLPFQDYNLSLGISVAIFWLTVLLRDDSEKLPPMRLFQEVFCISLGLNLLGQSLLAYAYSSLMAENLPLLSVVVGGLISALLFTLWHELVEPVHPAKPGVMIVGFDAVAAQVAAALQPVLGIIDPEPSRVPAAFSYMGGMMELNSAVGRHDPQRIIVGSTLDDEQEKGSHTLLKLLHFQSRGVVLESAEAAYERILNRTSIRSLEPKDFFPSNKLFTNPRNLALQSVYNNLIGLSLLACSLPLIIVLSIAIRLFSGPGAVIESTEFMGLHRIPFHLLRFRTQRRDGRVTPLGLFMERLRLEKLPRLFNLIRGEVVLLGPKPVQAAYAQVLEDSVPFYCYRFAVKPGLFSWAAKETSETGLPHDLVQLEHDIYYIRQASPLLDLQLFLDVLMGTRRQSAIKPKGALFGTTWPQY